MNTKIIAAMVVVVGLYLWARQTALAAPMLCSGEQKTCIAACQGNPRALIGDCIANCRARQLLQANRLLGQRDATGIAAC